MNEIDKIKKRINKRKEKININSEVRILEENKGNKVFKILMGIMAVYALFMSFAIYAKKDENAVVLNNVFNTKVNFSNFNKTLNKLLNLRIVDTNLINEDTEVVSGDVIYINVGGDYYTSEGNLVVAQDDGVVTYVNGKDENYTIIVEYDSGIRATYNGVYEVNVFVNDRVYKDDIVGSFLEKVEIIYIRNSEKISYEEVIAII